MRRILNCFFSKDSNKDGCVSWAEFLSFFVEVFGDVRAPKEYKLSMEGSKILFQSMRSLDRIQPDISLAKSHHDLTALVQEKKISVDSYLGLLQVALKDKTGLLEKYTRTYDKLITRITRLAKAVRAHKIQDIQKQASSLSNVLLFLIRTLKLDSRKQRVRKEQTVRIGEITSTFQLWSVQLRVFGSEQSLRKSVKVYNARFEQIATNILICSIDALNELDKLSAKRK
eukprot:TRINITY_DN1075_c0_g1_i1.p1 TRINITY_DN1075_c0_g1~~TRINITY_DN1075_c0_g1_i1.p1  ORF type:complete len:228 (-),score=32.62 TRINITY_DN1075_c0_g1_i1:35-718(-)